MLGKAEVLRIEQQSFLRGRAGSTVPVQPQQKYADDHGKSNLFLALVPERAVALQAVETGREIARRYGLSKSPRPYELMHVSLNAIGTYPDFPDDIVFAVSAAMATVKAAPFEVNFDRAMSVTNARAVILANAIRSEEMMDLHVQLAKEMWSVGLNFTYNPRFMPHMTVLYDDVPVPEHVLAEPVRWIASEFVLIRSVIGKSEYEYLDRWPLLD
jgi:RNA 2',3'-cyclic 3'-phosphodiesterase